MDVIIKDLFFTNTIISENIKTRKIIYTIEKNDCEYELVSTPFISIIEKISDRILLNTEIFINLFLIYEREKFKDNTFVKEISYTNLKKILVKLYKDNDSMNILEEFLNEFYKIVYINIKLYDNILKYEVLTSISRFFEYLENSNNMLFLTEEEKGKKTICNICFEEQKYVRLMCCKQIICIDCWVKGSFIFCPYCRLDFTKKLNININKIRNIYYRNW